MLYEKVKQISTFVYETKTKSIGEIGLGVQLFHVEYNNVFSDINLTLFYTETFKLDNYLLQEIYLKHIYSRF